MYNMMKKIVVILMVLAASLSLQAAINEKYEQGYDLKALSINTDKNETNISLFGENKMLFLLEDEAYLSDFTANKEDLQTPVEAEELKKLAIKGNVAYDNAKNKIYFIVEESSDSHWIYEASLKEDKWTNVRRLEIEGMDKVRGNNAFMANAGWSYLSKVKAIMINPAIAKNGNRLYFTSETIEGGEGGKDLWYMDLKSDDTWTKPVNAGKTINTSSDEDFAFIENDEILYFSSNKSGVRDLYMAKANGNAWNKAEKMPEPYNSAVNDYSIVVTNGVPYLISERNVGNGADIFAFVLRPEEPIQEEEKPEEIEKEFYWVDFFFEFDKAELTERSKSDMERLAVEMRNFTDAKFEISGYTDARGSNAYNDRLSERRAKAVKEALIQKGFKEENLTIVAKGERFLHVRDAKTDEQHAQNRRVEVRIINAENK